MHYLPKSQLPCPDFVKFHSRARSDAIALVDAESRKQWSYTELDRDVGRAVTVLLANGLSRGDRAAAVLPNSPELLVLQLACARIGATLAPLNWRLSNTEIEVLLADCEPAIVIGDDALGRIAVGTNFLTIAEFREALGTASAATQELAPSDVPSLMLYTSGTTGRPKGVVLTEANLLANALNFAVLGEVTADSAFLIDVPMFHVIGMVTSIRPALMMGGKIVISRKFDPEVTLRRLSDPQLAITHYFCVPQIADMLRGHPDFEPDYFRGLKALFTGGAPHPEASIRGWLAYGVTIVDGYGMTEAGTVLGMPLDRETVARKAGSCGILPPTMDCRIVTTDGNDVEHGQVGELLIRGPNLFATYWRNPEATAEAFTADGFLRTGDLVRRDEDGFFYLVGRRKEMYISGGENVYPAEVEAALRCCSGVQDAAVIGIPDERWGEVGFAFIVPTAPAQQDEQAILTECQARLARYKLPRKIRFVDELPRTGSGKVAKDELQLLSETLR